MTTEPTAPAWQDIVHEVRATGTGRLQAATLAAFATIVPDHADVEVRQPPYSEPDGWTLVGTWPHEPDDDVQRPDTAADAAEHAARFDPAHWPEATNTRRWLDTPRWGGVPTQQPDAAPAQPCAAEYHSRPCIRPWAHDGAHVYATALAAAAAEQQTATPDSPWKTDTERQAAL